MLCPMRGDGAPTSSTAAYQKRTGQPLVAGSWNPLPLGMGSVKFFYLYYMMYSMVGDANR